MNKFYATTAIDYINGRPHLGHAFEKVGADVAARFHRLQGDRVFFLTGTDEHSLNVQRQAAQAGITPREYCDQQLPPFKEAWEQLRISYDGFVRTTDPQHEAAVKELFLAIWNKGYLYEGEYNGLYCPSCENYFAEKDAPDLKCPLHQRPLERVQERNFFFKLSAFQNRLEQLITSEQLCITPAIRRNEILGVLQEGLRDVSLTRSNVSWGVPCPVTTAQTVGTNQTIWIWFDALVNYISAVGYGSNQKQFESLWPADIHIIGKDISRFHCLLWPALLLAADLPLPKKIFIHGFVSIKKPGLDAAKLSKTTGNIIEPGEVIQKYGSEDALRYYLLREIPFDGDGEFSWERLEARYNADLANDLGNLVNRTLTLIQRYRDGVIPAANSEDLDEICAAVIKLCADRYKRLDYRSALEGIWLLVSCLNKYVDENKPWVLSKDPAQAKRLDEVLLNLARGAYLLSVLLEPALPSTAINIRLQLGCMPLLSGNWEQETRINRSLAGTKLGTITPLFPKTQRFSEGN